MVGVLDVLCEDLEVIDRSGEARRQRCSRRVAPLGDFAGGTGGITGDVRLQRQFADDLATLAECMDMAVDVGDRLQRRAVWRHQMKVDWQEVLGDDVEAGVRQQVMDVGDAAGDRILDRDHCVARLALLHEADGVLEGRARHRFASRIHFIAGDVGVGAGFALVGDANGGRRPAGAGPCFGRSGYHRDALKSVWRVWADNPEASSTGVGLMTDYVPRIKLKY